MKRKALCFLLSVLFCFYSLSVSSSAVDDSIPALLSLDSDEYVLTADSSLPFGLSDQLLLSDDFLSLEELPYGENSLVFSFRMLNYVYHIIVDGRFSSEIYCAVRNDGLRFAVEILSFSPVYRVAYNITTGKYITMSSFRGLAQSGTILSETDSGTIWQYSYNFSNYADVYCTMSSNNSLVYDYGQTSNYLVTGYPTQAAVNAAYEKHQITLQEEANETSNNILNNIKNLPDKFKSFFTELGEKITSLPTQIAEWISVELKDLFIPDEEFMSTYSNDFQVYFEDRFGVLYEVPEYIISVFETFIDFIPEEEQYKITFPGITLPVLKSNGEFENYILIAEQDFNFNDILEISAINVLYTGYRSFIWLMFIFMLFNLIMKKYNQMVGVNG